MSHISKVDKDGPAQDILWSEILKYLNNKSNNEILIDLILITT